MVVGGRIPRGCLAVEMKTMLRISAAAGVGEAESQAGCRVGGLSVGVMRTVGRASQSGRKAVRRRHFLNLVYANLKLTRVIYA